MSILYSKDNIEVGVRILANKLNFEYSGVDGREEEPVIIISILKGAIYFTADLTKLLEFPITIEFVRIQSYFDEMTPQEDPEIDFSTMDWGDLSSMNVLILDDICDTGYTLVYLIREILKFHLVKEWKNKTSLIFLICL